MFVDTSEFSAMNCHQLTYGWTYIREIHVYSLLARLSFIIKAIEHGLDGFWLAHLHIYLGICKIEGLFPRVGLRLITLAHTSSPPKDQAQEALVANSDEMRNNRPVLIRFCSLLYSYIPTGLWVAGFAFVLYFCRGGCMTIEICYGFCIVLCLVVVVL